MAYLFFSIIKNMKFFIKAVDKELKVKFKETDQNKGEILWQ